MCWVLLYIVVPLLVEVSDNRTKVLDSNCVIGDSRDPSTRVERLDV